MELKQQKEISAELERSLDESSQNSYKFESKLESLGQEYQEYIDKVDKELNNQRKLRDDDQAIFNQVASSRDVLQIEINTKEQDLINRDDQISRLTLSIQELEKMVSALQSLAMIKEDMVKTQTKMQQAAKTSELQIAVLKQEVDVAAEFLIDQEQRLVRANGTINDLISKLKQIEEQLALKAVSID